MTIATGIAKQLRYKLETTWGTLAGTSGGQLLRRVTSDLNLTKDTYESGEIRSDYQVQDFRHGVRKVEGNVNGELSPGTFKDFFAAALRQDFQTAATTGSIITVTAAASSPQFVRSSGSFLTDGFKVGDVVQWTGFASPATGNNVKNFLVTALTALNMTGIFVNGDAVVARAAGDSVTCTLKGKKTWVPTSGHTDPSFTFEHWHSDVTESERFAGCKLGQMTVQLPPTGIATLGMQFSGKNMTSDASTAYFTSPAAETTTGVIASVNGAVYVGGTKVALLTGLNLTINGNLTMEPVVGSNTYPDIFEGRVKVNGQMTVFFEDGTFRDYFDQETEVSVYGVFATGDGASADFVSFTLPRIKAGGANKDDGEKGLVQTIPFTALLNAAGGAAVDSLKTTISIQDSQA
jgi:hypothetical protein